MNKKQKLIVRCQMSTFSGQSLLEVVVAIAIAAMLAVSVVSTTLITQKSAKSAENKTGATKLAQEAIEQIRIFRDRQGFDKLINGDCYNMGSAQYPNPSDWKLLSNYCQDAVIQGEPIKLENTSFYRKISIENDPADPSGDSRKLITVTVGWEESGGEQKIVNYTYLSRWEDL